MFKEPPSRKYLNAELLESKDGLNRFRFNPDERMENPFGVILGGILAAMADMVLGNVAWSIAKGKRVVTLNMTTNFLAPARANESLLGLGQVVRSGKKTAYSECKIIRESDGELLLRASATNIFIEE